MDEALHRQIQARFEELPADVQQAIQSSNLDAKIQELGRKHSLHLDQIGNLSDEVHMVMLGFSDPGEFPEQLAKELNLPADKAEALAQDVSTALFMPIRKSMQEFSEEQSVHAAIVSEAAPAPAAPSSPIATSAPAATPIKSPTIAAPAPVPPVATPAPLPTAPQTMPKPPVVATPAPKPAELHPADMMLSQKTVTVAPVAPAPAAPTPATAPAALPGAAAAAPTKPEPPAPKPYAADPYREPIQ